MPTDGATDVTLMAPAWTRLLGLLGSAGFVAGGYFLLTRPMHEGVFSLKAALAGWLSIAFFGACALACTIQLVPRFRARLVITEHGFSSAGPHRPRYYAWADIVGRFAVWQFGRTKLVVFTSASARRNLSQAISGHNASLPAHLGRSADSLAALMNARLEAARARSAAPPQPAALARPAFGRKGMR